MAVYLLLVVLGAVVFTAAVDTVVHLSRRERR